MEVLKAFWITLRNKKLANKFMSMLSCELWESNGMLAIWWVSFRYLPLI